MIPKISLASGVMPGATALQTTIAAVAAGFDAVGLWIEPTQWTEGTTRAVRSHLASTGLAVLDVEVIWIKPGPFNTDHLRIVDIGAELGAPNALVVSSDPDRDATTEKYARICQHAAGANMRASLEFAPFTDVGTLSEALSIVRAVAQPSAALLIDPLHLDRSGGRPELLRDLPTDLFSYAQFCDAPAVRRPGANRETIRLEAVDDRQCPGEGGLPLKQLLNELPAGLPLSIEVRSRYLREAFPDCTQRASVVARATRRWLERYRHVAAQ